MSRIRTLGLLFVLASAVATAAAQGPAEIRLASLTPDGSVWDKHLKLLAADWTKTLGGKTAVNVFANGSLGDDKKVATSMLTLGRPQAAALTVIGLSEVDKAFNVFSMPFFYGSYDELYAVMDAMRPTMAQKLDQKGLVLLAWGYGGWAQVFTTKPVKTLDELRKIKLFTSAGDQAMERLYRQNGFNPQALEINDIMTSLSSGLIEGIPSPATAALSYQWFRQTKYMIDAGLAPVTGGLVISKRTWNTLPEAARTAMMDSARAMEAKLKKEIPSSEKASVAAMVERKLTVLPATGPEWKTIGETFSKGMLDLGIVPRDVYDLAVRERDTFRKKK